MKTVCRKLVILHRISMFLIIWARVIPTPSHMTHVFTSTEVQDVMAIRV